MDSLNKYVYADERGIKWLISQTPEGPTEFRPQPWIFLAPFFELLAAVNVGDKNFLLTQLSPWSLHRVLHRGCNHRG